MVLRWANAVFLWLYPFLVLSSYRVAVWWMMYFPIVFLFNVGEESGITQVPFSAGTSVLSLLLFVLYDNCILVRALLVTHQNIIN